MYIHIKLKSILVTFLAFIFLSINIVGVSAATNFRASQGTYSDKIVINWTPDANVQNYVIKRKMGENNSYRNLGWTESINQYIDYNVEVGYNYYYKIQPFYLNGDFGQLSNECVGYLTKIKPETPTNFVASQGISCNHITLSWNHVSSFDYISAYKIEIYDSNNSLEPTSGLGPGKKNNTGYREQPDTVKYYRIKTAYPWGEESSFSNYIMGYTLPVPVPPENLNASQGLYSDKIVISWKNIADIKEYSIVRCDENYNNCSNIGTSVTNSFIDSNIISGKKYIYRVNTFIDACDAGSEYSNPATGYAKILEPDIQLICDTHSFNKILIGETSNPNHCIIKNIGNSELSINSLTIISNSCHQDSFEIENDQCNNIQPGSHCNFDILFHPTSLEKCSSNISIKSNDPDISDLNTSFEGTGFGFSKITVDPFYYDFDSNPSYQDFTISNSGYALLCIQNISLTGQDYSAFSIIEDQCSNDNLPISSSCKIRVKYTPSSDKQEMSFVTILSNDPEIPIYKISLRGNYLKGDVDGDGFITVKDINTIKELFSFTHYEITSLGYRCDINEDGYISGADISTLLGEYQKNISGIISASPFYHDFSTEESYHDFTITNIGTDSLSIQELNLTGIDASNFNIVDNLCSNQSLPISSNCTFKIKYTPSDSKQKVAFATILSDDPNTPIYKLSLRGSYLIGDVDGDGLIIEADFDALSIAYNKYQNGYTFYELSSLGYRFDLGNMYGYEKDGIFDSLDFNVFMNEYSSSDNDNDGFKRKDNDCDDLNPKIFPGADEICVDGIDQDCNGGDMACLGIMSITPTEIIFGQMKLHNFYKKELIVSNIGHASLEINDLTITYNSPDNYILNNNCLNQILLPQDYCNIELVFKPITSGIKHDIILLNSISLSTNITFTVNGLVQNKNHFNEIHGNPTENTWTIYLASATLDGINLQPEDEIALFDNDIIVGSYKLSNVLAPTNQFSNFLTAWSTLEDSQGYNPGQKYHFKCWIMSTEKEWSQYSIIFKNSSEVDSYSGNVFPTEDALYSVIELNFLSTSTQEIPLKIGYQLVSSYIQPIKPQLNSIFENILPHLEFVKDSKANFFRKIGPTIVNNIGSWNITEGYLIKMNDTKFLNLEGSSVDDNKDIYLNKGYQIVSYLKTESSNAIQAFDCILDNLIFAKNEQGAFLRRIESQWINNIGMLEPGKGYLVKMNHADVLNYSATRKKQKINIANNYVRNHDRHFPLIYGNPLEPTWTLYISKATINGFDLKPNDEIAILDGNTIVGSFVLQEVLTDANKLNNYITAWNLLNDDSGYQPGNIINVIIWDAQNEREYKGAEIIFMNMDGAFVQNVFPAHDGAFSIVNIQYNKPYTILNDGIIDLKDVINLLQYLSKIKE